MIDDPFAVAILGRHHKIVDLPDYWIWRDIYRAAKILLVVEQIDVHASGHECVGVGILEKGIQAFAITEAPMQTPGYAANEGGRVD